MKEMASPLENSEKGAESTPREVEIKFDDSVQLKNPEALQSLQEGDNVIFITTSHTKTDRTINEFYRVLAEFRPDLGTEYELSETLGFGSARHTFSIHKKKESIG